LERDRQEAGTKEKFQQQLQLNAFHNSGPLAGTKELQVPEYLLQYTRSQGVRCLPGERIAWTTPTIDGQGPDQGCSSWDVS
jgi:hypothetical protein